MTDTGSTRLEQRLSAKSPANVFFDRFNRGRYATDARLPDHASRRGGATQAVDEALRALVIARDAGGSSRRAAAPVANAPDRQ